jgi:hypothetical protein
MDREKRDHGMGDAANDREKGRLDRMADTVREKAGKAKESLSAGASGVLDATRTVAGETRDRAGRAARFVKEAETDEQLKSKVSARTESSLDRAADAVTSSAPAIGRSAERAARVVGGALHTVAHPLAKILGVIAGTLGGWWKKAAEKPFLLSEVDEAECRAHFTSIEFIPADMTFDRARTGYAVGYVASRNPDYADRSFDDLEPDLRRGFGDEYQNDYEALRDFARFGYEKGRTAG